MAMSMRERLHEAIRGYSFIFEDDETIEAMVDAVLSELLTPTGDMMASANDAYVRCVVDDDDPTEPMNAAWSAAILAAKEGK